MFSLTSTRNRKVKVVYLRWFHLCRCRNEQPRYLRYGRISGNVVSIVYISGVLLTGLLEWSSIFPVLKLEKLTSCILRRNSNINCLPKKSPDDIINEDKPGYPAFKKNATNIEMISGKTQGENLRGKNSVY